MKKRVIIGLLICSVLLCIALPLSPKSYADPFTAGQIASTAYAMMQSWGISFTAGSASATGMNDFMTHQVQDYVNSKGGSIADVFVGQIAVDVAGKLVIGQQMYNSFIGFVDWLKDKYDLSSVDFSLTNGDYGGEYLPANKDGKQPITGNGIEVVFQPDSVSGRLTGYLVYNGGKFVKGGAIGSPNRNEYLGSYEVYYSAPIVWASMPFGPHDKGEIKGYSRVNAATVEGGLNNSLSWSVPENWSMPTVLNPDKEWTGTIGGYSEPDTNLDQLLQDINQAVADNNLVVDGEVIDVPIPPPTPQPIDPDTPLSDVPWEGMDTNLQNLYNQGLEEIGKIGEAKDAITDAVVDQTGALEGAIANNAGVVSGAIDQAVSDVQTAIGNQTAALDESLSATAAGVDTIAEAVEDEEINWKKFDLKGLFPFCIPFDIYNMLKALDASPTAPHVQLPFVIPSIGFSYELDLDFSAFDQVAAIMRQMELICYGLALAWATSKVIKW